MKTIITITEHANSPPDTTLAGEPLSSVLRNQTDPAATAAAAALM